MEIIVRFEVCRVGVSTCRAWALKMGIGMMFSMVGIGALSAHAAQDPSRAPAVMSRLSERSVLVGIAVAGTRFVAAGERGHILYSDDNGSRWTQAKVPVQVTLTAIAFADAKRGWAVGHLGCILRTEDGGTTWAKQFDGHDMVKAIEAQSEGIPPARVRWLVAEGANQPFLDILVLDADNAIVIGAYGLIFVTADGGRNWRAALDRLGSPREDRHLYALQKIGSTLYLVGEQGLLYSSNDGGQSFQSHEAPAPGTFFAVVGAGADVMLLSLRGRAFRTRDAGRTWQALDSPAQSSLTDGFATADGLSFVLVDGGGNVWRFDRKGSEFHRVAATPVFLYAGVAKNSEGAIVIVGAGGFAFPQEMTRTSLME